MDTLKLTPAAEWFVLDWLHHHAVRTTLIFLTLGRPRRCCRTSRRDAAPRATAITLSWASWMSRRR
jgi:hypothetical protein